VILKVKCKALQQCNSCRTGNNWYWYRYHVAFIRRLKIIVEDVRSALMHSDTCSDIEIILGSAWRSGIYLHHDAGIAFNFRRSGIRIK